MDLENKVIKLEKRIKQLERLEKKIVKLESKCSKYEDFIVHYLLIQRIHTCHQLNRNMFTIKDIAEFSGLSSATVHRRIKEKGYDYLLVHSRNTKAKDTGKEA
ncbi:MAG: winged helix-turn-helix transcriptional regulator [Fusobacteriaceae bacterium]